MTFALFIQQYALHCRVKCIFQENSAVLDRIGTSPPIQQDFTSFAGIRLEAITQLFIDVSYEMEIRLHQYILKFLAIST